MNELSSKKAELMGDLHEWFFPALVAFILGMVVMYLMYKGMIPDVLNLFVAIKK